MSRIPPAAARVFLLVVRRLCLLAALLAPGAVRAQAPGAGTLQPGDTVFVSVWNRDELSGRFAVSGNGTLGHPLYSDLVVAGVHLDTVRARVAELIGRYQANPRVVVEPRLRVTVTGEVRRAGLFSLPPETTLAQAVALAGGGTETAQMRSVRLSRGGTETVFDLSRLGTGFSQELIRSGDQIFVPRRRNIFREYVAPVSSLVAALGSLGALIIAAAAP